MREATDAELISRSLERPEAFERLFDRHFDGVFGYLRRRAGAQAAEELAAETFTRAFDLRSRYDLARPDARPWLFGIATNVLREQRRRPGAALAAAAEPVQPPPDDPPAVELVDALRALTPGEREALLLHAWADLSYAQIAEALGVPVGTVRSRLSRARAHMRERLVREEAVCDG